MGDKVIIEGLNLPGYTGNEEWEIIDDESLIKKLSSGDGLAYIITSKVTDLSVIYAYQYRLSTNLIKTWDVSNVTNMSYLFASSFIFPDLSFWDVSNVTNMQSIFERVNNYPYYQPPDGISNWDVSNVTNMSRMFFNNDFNGDISNWDVSNVTNMQSMFENSEFNGDISNWDVSGVTNMYQMLKNNTYFNINLSPWDVNKVIICKRFSNGASNFTLSKPNFTNCSPV